MPVGGATINGAQNRPTLVAVANSWRDFVSGNPEGTPDPTPTGAELTAIAPTTAVHGGANVTLTGTGTGFVKGVHEITFDGAALTTTYVSATSLTAQAPVAARATAGAVSVRVTGAEGVKTFTFT